MEIQGNILPGFKIFEYMVVLDPNEELRNKITGARQEFMKEFKSMNNLGVRPNLGIAQFMQYEMKEERIRSRLNVIAMGFPAFKVELKDFGSFPSHSIFINVVSKLPVQKLSKAIRTDTQKLMTLNKETKPHFLNEPQITIGRKLLPWQYEKAWLKYSTEHFTGRFIADGMLLLKRPRTEKVWQIVKRYEFQNLSVGTAQGELFS